MLERVQRRFTRMVPGLGELEYGERLGVLGMMTLEERRNRSDMVEMYKVFKRIVCHTKGNILRIEWKWQDQRKFVEGLSRKLSRRTSGSSSFLRESSTDGMLLMRGWLRQRRSMAFKKRLHEDCEKKMGLLTGH